MTAKATRALSVEDAQPITRRLISVADRFQGRLRDRVGKLLQTAKDATRQLAEVDLVRFEADAEQGSHSLAAWEEVAPAMAQTVQSVNRLLAVAEAVFPGQAQNDDAEDLDAAFSPASPGRV